MSEEKVLTAGSLFAGIGGICIGFKSAGFKVKWANEYDKYAAITYRHNFPDTTLDESDIRDLSPAKLGYTDVITAGFPCQAFSIAGYQKGFRDPRGNLFFDTARFIDELKPKAYLLENVKNLVTHDKGRTFQIIRETLTKELNYSFIPFVLNAKQYGNIPQTRERIYVVGFRDEGDVEYSPECTLFGKESHTCQFNIPKPIPLTQSINDVLTKNKVADSFYYNNHRKLFPILEQAITSEETVYQWRRKYVRENKSNVCPTLTANMGTGGHNVPLIKDEYGIRKLTPDECARFQGFPQDFEFPSTMANSHKYKQAGNSVVITVISRIAKEIFRVLTL